LIDPSNFMVCHQHNNIIQIQCNHTMSTITYIITQHTLRRCIGLHARVMSSGYGEGLCRTLVGKIFLLLLQLTYKISFPSVCMHIIAKFANKIGMLQCDPAKRMKPNEAVRVLAELLRDMNGEEEEGG
jgi:hypothetical protein